MPDENSIINALVKASPPLGGQGGQGGLNELDQARREIAEIIELRKIIATQGAKIAEYEHKATHHQAAVDLAAHRAEHIEQLSRDLASVVADVRERDQIIEQLQDENLRLGIDLEAAQHWSATWKAAAKTHRSACRSLGRSVGRLTQRNAALTRERNEAIREIQRRNDFVNYEADQ